MEDPRREELRERLASVRARIDGACRAAGRDPGEVTLVAITKNHPLDDIRRLVELGVHHLGENRDQEAAPKFTQIKAEGLTPVVHFVGQLQRNKAGSVCRYADVVESVDRAPLVAALSRHAQAAGRQLQVLCQIDLAVGDLDPHRGGVQPDRLEELADLVAEAPGLSLRGTMAVAPLGEPPEAAFARLAELTARVRAAHPDATWLSAGMSADLEAAIAAGATHVRVGTAILGSREPFR